MQDLFFSQQAVLSRCLDTHVHTHAYAKNMHVPNILCVHTTCAKHLRATHAYTRDAHTCQTHTNTYMCIHTLLMHYTHTHTHEPDMHACAHSQHTSLLAPEAFPHFQFTVLMLWSLSDLSSGIFSSEVGLPWPTAHLWIFSL